MICAISPMSQRFPRVGREIPQMSVRRALERVFGRVHRCARAVPDQMERAEQRDTQAERAFEERTILHDRLERGRGIGVARALGPGQRPRIAAQIRQFVRDPHRQGAVGGGGFLHRPSKELWTSRRANLRNGPRFPGN
jgi:hypothetical protein